MLVDVFLNIALGVIGIGFTLLTVLQSFVENKKSAMQSYAKAIKETYDAESNPMIYEKEQKRLASEYIVRQKKLIKRITLVIFLSLFLYGLNLYPKFDMVTSVWFYGIDVAIFVAYIILLIYLVYAYINLYEKNVNNRTILKAISSDMHEFFEGISASLIGKKVKGVMDRLRGHGNKK